MYYISDYYYYTVSIIGCQLNALTTTAIPYRKAVKVENFCDCRKTPSIRSKTYAAVVSLYTDFVLLKQFVCKTSSGC